MLAPEGTAARPRGAALELDFDFDCGIPARVDDLPPVDADDFIHEVRDPTVRGGCPLRCGGLFEPGPPFPFAFPFHVDPVPMKTASLRSFFARRRLRALGASRLRPKLRLGRGLAFRPVRRLGPPGPQSDRWHRGWIQRVGLRHARDRARGRWDVAPLGIPQSGRWTRLGELAGHRLVPDSALRP